MEQAARADGILDSHPEDALGGLGAAVDDVHTMLATWSAGSDDIATRQPIDELDIVIAHLRAAAATLSRLVATTADCADGVRFAAINDADRIVCGALIMLLDAYTGGLTRSSSRHRSPASPSSASNVQVVSLRGDQDFRP